MSGPDLADLVIATVPFDDPDAVRLIAGVQQEYVHRYGGEDATPTSAAEFTPPGGLFLVAYLNGIAVGCGGWRAHTAADDGFADGDAEVKRMYVAPAARGLGVARAMLAELERTAAQRGRLRAVLETGLKQPEAISLYESSGYHAVPPFGMYRDFPNCRCFGKSLT